MKKATAFVVTASLASSALFGFSPALSAHAMTKTAAEPSVPQGPKAALNSIYKLAHNGQMPYYAEGLKIGVQSKKDVHHKLGKPYPETGQSGFDLYHAEMGNPGFAFHYDKKGKINEIRYFGTNVEKETNIGGMTPSLLKKQLGPADTVSTIPQTNEKKYVYQTGDYELEFIVGHDPDISEHELTVVHINLIKASS
ncbi:YjgB family protein [Bacillus sp. 28A-2]|uniref:YjgB family protein n=1 Tax=Bacillus sp. 28A-2 TaxID=2772252 RepID=UPI00168D758C|nr:YjgB family protein [Bacillus sp. 28A-2]MBD3860774.1 YjgB family protein [Bacillus sp. 28A-2]